MLIRPEHPEDYTDVLRLTYQAFLTLDYPGRRRIDEHYLIYLLQGSPFVIPELCFVAQQDGEIVGHILYTKSEIMKPDGSAKYTVTFGPLSVQPHLQRQGIGSALVRHSMDRARQMGFGAVMITGVPDYYPKLGFKRAKDYELTLPDGSADDAFMAFELETGYLSGGGTLHFLPSEFEQAENDDAGFEAFHKRFMADNYPEKLILRPLFDNDIALMERWLYMSHVAKWYKYPGHWLRELYERRGEFSFITHFIAELEGIPIGFCQYYDCFFAQQHEVWNDRWRVGDGQGEIYSIDYLIGEPEFLRRGFGREMISQMLYILQRAGVKTVIAEPEKDNAASNGALVANGFVWNGEGYHLELES